MGRLRRRLGAWPAALGFGVALRQVFPDTREQRDWVHKTANVLTARPKSAHPGAKAALAEIWGGGGQAPRQRGSTPPAHLEPIE